MSDGTTKPIEQVKVGDTVLSKNEKTGEIAAKKVTNVSVRADIWTRKLTFDNGTVLETTDEHPLYADGRGFVKAKEVGIGSSIVTRAGPSAKVVGVQADVRQATVYNFTVDAFHTYFVGDAALWVHNNGACEIEKVMGRPFREVNPEFPPDSSALNRFAAIEQRPGYCDDFSNALYDASNSADKRLLRIVNEGGRKDVFNLEKGSLEPYKYHDVFSDGRYVYDKLLSPNPIPKGDWEQYMAKLNPGSTILQRPRDAPWNFGFTPL